MVTRHPQRWDGRAWPWLRDLIVQIKMARMWSEDFLHMVTKGRTSKWLMTGVRKASSFARHDIFVCASIYDAKDRLQGYVNENKFDNRFKVYQSSL
jgi:hypothetical protein